MRKHFPYLRWKYTLLHAPLFLLLIASTAITGVNASPPPYLSVEPPSAEISAPGQSVNITVVVHDVTDHYGCDFDLIYNDTLLEYQKAKTTAYGPGAVVNVDNGNPLPSGALTIVDVSVPGTVRLSFLFRESYDMDPVEPGIQSPPSFNGTGVVAWITFKGLIEGVSPLNFDEVWTFIYDPTPAAQPRDPCVPGEIKVIPEFPTATLMPLLLILTLIAVFLGKKFSQRSARVPSVLSR